MILKKIKLNNFRQFYGEQEIEFSSEGNNNITTILGENGCGKTGIYRAMIFCLYGEKAIKDSEKNVKDPSEQVHLINLNYLDEHKDSICTASVILEMSHDRKTYILKRTVDGKKNSATDEIKENDELTAELQVIDEKGNFQPRVETNQKEINRIVNDILDIGLKDFFFFDGEQIENLSKTDSEMRKAIKNGITKLLQIDQLEDATRIVNQSLFEQKRNIKNSNPTSSLNRIIEEIEGYTKKIEELQRQLDDNNKEYNRLTSLIESTEDKLKKNSEIKEIYSKISDKKSLRATKNENLSINRRELTKIAQENASSLILDGFMLKAVSILNNSLNTENVILPTDKLDKMLSEHKCLCCNRTFEEGDLSYMYITSLKKLQEKMGNQRDISGIVNSLQTTRKINEKESSSITEYLNAIENTNESIENINREIADLNKQVTESSMKEEKLRELEESLKKYEVDRSDLKKTINRIEYDLEKARETLVEKENEKKKIQDDEKNQNKEFQKYNYLDNLLKMLEGIKEKYSSRMRAKLSKEATDIFKELIADKDKDLISKIEIGTNYEIIVKGWDNTSILQDISSGQRQVVSLSVIVGLAIIACGNNIDIPLFMDTPFGRVSGENRSNIISTISRKVGQWILLVTDTEMTQFEYNELLKTQKWGKFYILDNTAENGKTIINEKDKNLYEPKKAGDMNA